MATAVGLTKDKGLDLTLDCPATLPLVYVDKTRIRQILLNLLSNAAKFTEHGGISVRVLFSEAMLRIEVEDSGIGIAPEHQALVFEEFQQVDGNLTRQYQGTGLGLPISKRLVEMHGGQMGLISTPGQSSTFFFTLPFAQPARLLDEALAPTGSDMHDPARPVVIVVDDDPSAQAILRQYLEEAGYAVQSVLDSREALATIWQLQPQLAILDIAMPYLDGWQLLGQLKATPQTAAFPLLICSIMEQQQLGISLGIRDYLVKPVREDALLERVAALVQKPATVLVIDDDPDARWIVRATLAEHQYRVLEAENGVQGLAAVAAERPDLVVLDLMMPEMDGFTLLERLRAEPDYAALPVIVTTAKELEEHERQWLQEHTRMCLQKSQLTADAFVRYVNSVLTYTPRNSPDRT